VPGHLNADVFGGLVAVVGCSVVCGFLFVVRGRVAFGLLLVQSPQTHVSTGSKCPYLVQVPQMTSNSSSQL
jgi:hypothetical protein